MFIRKKQLILNLKIRLLFYRYAWLPNGLISILCLCIVKSWGFGAIAYLFWLKIISFLLIAFHIGRIRDKEFYFFYNMGFSKQPLWISAFSADLFLLILLATAFYG